MLKQDSKFASPVSVLFYENYKSENQLNELFELNNELIQCVCANNNELNKAIPLGQAQLPTLNDYADNVDTIDFIINL